MLQIEIIGLDPPCVKCEELLNNVKKAVDETGIEAEIEKKWVLSKEILNQYGLLLSPALAIEGIVVVQGKVYKTERIIGLING